MDSEVSTSGKYPRVGAVVLNWNAYEDTAACIASLKKATYPLLDIVLVDNGSTDGSAERLAHSFAEVPLLKLSANKGYAAGNNEGIRFSLRQGADYVLVINNDTIVEPSFLGHMVDVAESNPQAGVVTCKAFLGRDRRRTYGTGGFFSRIRCGTVPLSGMKEETECEVSFISGCVLLVKRQVFEQLGLLDERYFMYCEDLEFSLRVGRHFKLFYTPKGIIYHESGAGDRWGNYKETYLFYNTRNRFLLFEKFPVWYRAYVFAYSFANSMAKSVAILAYGVDTKDLKDAIRRAIVLWKGFCTGFLHSNRMLLRKESYGNKE